MVDKASTRQAYGNALVELGRTNPNIVVLDADLSSSTMTCMFAREFPDRFFD
ncbi:MAG: transketolase family protein, partial [Chloroflexota bacterium]